LREAAENTAYKLGIRIYFPSKHLSTDNAAMIAAAGYFHLKNGDRADIAMTADITMRLQNVDNEDADLRKRNVRYRL
jgi:N6-L-threonylcarbamoyladenine synthase